MNATVLLDEVSGLTIQKWNDTGAAIIDGTVELHGGWEQVSDPPSGAGVLWRSVQQHAAWQLFRGDLASDGDGGTRDHQAPARWPNARPWTSDCWDRDDGHWRYESTKSSFGHMVDEGPTAEAETDDEFGFDTTDGTTTFDAGSLGDINASVADCVAILNIGHWVTMHALVENHTAGSSNFTYSRDNCGSRDCPSARHPGDGKGRYFLEFCPQILDEVGEWSYNGTAGGGTILLRAPVGMDPNDYRYFGKNVTYSLVLRGCSKVTVKGLTFFATTMFDWRSIRTRVDTCHFNYPSFSKRALLNVRPDQLPSQLGNGEASAWWDGGSQFKITGAMVTGIVTKNTYDSNSTWFNNVFEYTDGPALKFERTGYDTVQNNRFYQIDCK